MEFQGKEMGQDQEEGGVSGEFRGTEERLGKACWWGITQEEGEVVWPSFSSLRSPYIVALAGWDWGHNKLWKSLQKQWKKRKKKRWAVPSSSKGTSEAQDCGSCSFLLRDNRKPLDFQYHAIWIISFSKVKSLKILMK